MVCFVNMDAGNSGESVWAAQAVSLVWHFGNIKLDGRSLTLHVGGQPTAIEHKPLALLMFFLAHPGEVVTKEEIFEALWPGRIVVEAALTNCVHKLRAALGDEDAICVQTVRGYGYRLVAELQVEKLPDTGSVAAAAPAMKAGQAPPTRAMWRLVRCLGSSSYGEVWLAQHAKLPEQRVFKFARGNAAGLTALKREVTLHRLMRNMLNPCDWLVNVLDWNLAEAPYFIETEYVSVGSIVDWANERGGIGAVPLAERLDLIVQTARALATAHSLGVLHKDIKPANLLVDTSDATHACIRLSDFGSGRLVDDDKVGAINITRLGFTQTGVGSDKDSGTLLYMAPEVLTGRPATMQADIYALGVILYQMLAGDLHKPLAPGWERDVSDELLREDIALAVAGSPEQRLTSATALARRLEQLEVRRRDRECERRQKQEAEHTRAALLRAQARRGLLRALVATFLIASVVAGILLWQTQRERAAAEREAALAQTVTHFLTDDLLSSANPMINQSRDVTIRQILNVASARLDHEFAHQPLAKASLERVIGTAYAAMGDRQKAEPLLLAAEKGLAAQLGDAAPQTEATRLALRDLYLDLFDIGAVETVAKRIDAAERGAGIPNPGAEFEARAMLVAMPAIAHSGANWLTNLYAPMHSLYQEARTQLGSDTRTTVRLLWYSGVALSWAHRYREAEPIHRQVFQAFQKIYGPTHPRTLEAGIYLAQALDHTGQADKARPLLLKMIGNFQRTLGPKHPFLLNTRRNLAENDLLTGKPEAAVKEIRDVYERRKALLGERSRPAELDAVQLAMTLGESGHPEAGIPILERVLQLQEKDLGNSAPQTLSTRDALGRLLQQMHRNAEAEALLRKNYRLTSALLPHGSWFLGEVAFQLGKVLKSENKPAEAKPLLQQAVSTFTRFLDPNDPLTEKAQQVLATL